MPAREIAQHLAPVYNDVNWYVIAASIAAGAALLTHGLIDKAQRLVRHRVLGPEGVVWAECVGIVVGCAGGGLAGWLTWHWGLGVLCGLVGSVASPWFVNALTGWLARWQ